MSFMGLSKAESKALEAEVISNDARLQLTRLIRRRARTSRGSEDANIGLIHRNQFINIANTVLGRPIYRLEPDDMGLYMSEEFAWHAGELELIMRRPDTAQLAGILGDLLQEDMLSVAAVNDILAADNSSIRFETHGFDENVSLHLLSTLEIEEETANADHPNIRLLVQRMETAYEQGDFSAVLHAGASVFETLAKLVINNTKVENETLGGIFQGYRKRSNLPDAVLDYIKETYDRRNTEPLAGHGATTPPDISGEEAAVLIEMTRMVVKLERRLAEQEFDKAPIVSKPASKPKGGSQIAD